mgnify:FL=1|jgi:hypothetical protein|tara:strand:+ start:614 stop:841 length:228 start_codon:yes stop_codon:yes gene_type:complete
MRAIVTKGGIYTWLNSRENEFLEENFDDRGKLLEKQNLDEREQHVAQTLVSRGILEKLVDNKTVMYKLNVNNYSR